MTAPASEEASGGKPPASGAVAVSVRDVAFGYRGGAPVLRGVNLEARTGEITIVLGTSGGGKTTLLRLVKGLLRPTSGEVLVLGAPPRGARGGPLDPRVAYVPQQLGLTRARTVLDNTLVGALASTGLVRSLLGRFTEEQRGRALDLLDSLGIGHKAHDPVHSLSGGERQRVAIARSLMQEPRVLLADEFVSQLDAVTSRQIMGQVREIAEGGVAVVVTTHELDLALAFADRLVVLRDGRTVLDSPARSLDESELAAAIRP